MLRGYDVIFQNKMLGYIFMGSLIFMFIALLVLGGLHAKKLMIRDSAARRKYREEMAEKEKLDQKPPE
jgi:hypothetical protein